MDRLQTADLRFCGFADQVLARLSGALSSDSTNLFFNSLLSSYLFIALLVQLVVFSG